MGEWKGLGSLPPAQLSIKHPERCNLDSIMMQASGGLGTVSVSKMGREQMSMPETVVAALALALTSLTLFEALAQND